MEEYKFYIDKNNSRWSLKDADDKRLYIGWNNPYKDTLYAGILDSALGAEASAELKDVFASFGFIGQPLMMSVDESGCIPVMGVIAPE